MDQNLKINILVNDKSKEAFSKLDKSLARVKSSIFNLKNAFLGFGAGVVIKGFVDAGIQIENLGVQLTALFGSAKAGQKALQEVTKYAIKTPFELKNIQQGITSLAVVRKTAEDAGISFEELLKITGNTATLLGNDFALASLQVQRSLSAGIASAELFRERGVTAMAGFTAGVRTSALDSAKALKKTFGTGGEFGQLTDELSKTVGGTISNLKDAFFTFQVAVSEGMFGTMKKQLGDLQQFVEKNDQAIKQFGRDVGEGLAKAINGLGHAVKFAYENFVLLRNILLGIIALKFILFLNDLRIAFGLLTTAVLTLNTALLKNPLIAGATAVVVGITLITKAYKDLREEMSKKLSAPMIDDDSGFFAEQQRQLEKEFGKLGGHYLRINPEVGGVGGRGTRSPLDGFERSPELFGRGGKEIVLSPYEKIRNVFQEMNKKELKEFEEKLKNIHKTIAEGLNQGIKDFSQGFAEAVVLGKSLGDTLKNIGQNLLVKMLSVLIEVLMRKSVEYLLETQIFAVLFQKLQIEKLITKEKQAQQKASQSQGKSGGGGDLQTAIQIASLFSGGGFAQGGTVSKGQPILVGERGAELFVPNQTGQITQNARGTSTGQPVSVNFNINTLDARGFDELLVRNRGTITQIINSAVNERGAKSLI
jgi:hypothetical protein